MPLNMVTHRVKFSVMKKFLLKVGLVGVLSVMNFTIWGQTYSPEIGAEDVATSPILTITFEPGSEIAFVPNNLIYIEVIGGDYFSLSTGGKSGPDPALSITDNVLTIDLSSYLLDENTEYVINTDENAITVDGVYWNELFYGNPNFPHWKFTTVSGTPIWSSGYPNLSNQSPTSITLNGRTDQDGHYYYVITPNLDPPSELQIEAGQDQNGNDVLSGNGTMYADQPFSESIDISSLTPGNTYYVHIVASSSSGYSDIKTKDIDLIAPSLSNISPPNGATNVSIYTTIILKYSEKIFGIDSAILNNSNIDNYIKLKEGSTVISYSITFSSDGKTLTIIPEAELNENTTYTISFLNKFEDRFGNVQSELSSDKTFTTEDLIIWTGESSNDNTNWKDADNWDASAYPDGNSVIIPSGKESYPVISSDISVNNLFIEPGASLSQTGGSLTINGEFVLQSSSEINASFIPYGGTVIVDPARVRFHQNVSAPDRNYNFGVPVTGATKATIGITNYLFQYKNADNSYIILDDDTPLVPGKGYICRSENSMIFTGTPVTSDVTVELERNNNGGLGWNLVANPFSATVDFTELEIDTAKVAYSFWIWDNIIGKYNTYNASSGIGIGIENYKPDIPSHQAFWVKVRPGYSTASIGFLTTALEVDSMSYLKSASSTKYPTLKLESTLNGNSITDETALVFTSEASNNLGDAFDTEKKLATNKNFCQIYTLEGSLELAINGLLPAQNELSVPLGFKMDTTGIVQINVKDNTLPPGSRVMLEDKVTSEFIDFSATGTYEFDVNEKGTDNSRLVLHISGTETESVITNIEEETKDEEVKKSYFYTNNSEIIAYIGPLNNPTYKLLDINGKVIDSGTLNPESENRIMVSRKGMIIMIVESEKEKLEFKTVF